MPPQPEMIINSLNLTKEFAPSARNVLWHHEGPPNKAFAPQKAKVQRLFCTYRNANLFYSRDACG